LKNEIRELSPDAFLPDLNASLGLVQWREYPDALESRMQLYDLFLKSVSGTRHNVLVSPEEPASAVPYSFPVVLTSPMNEVRRYAQKNGVETLPAFSNTIINFYPGTEDKCPSARSLYMNVLLFPLYPSLGKKNIQLIAKVLSTLP
jgi:dTDP-4-amino-4,6-dideoxygalactose transaminase